MEPASGYDRVESDRPISTPTNTNVLIMRVFLLVEMAIAALWLSGCANPIAPPTLAAGSARPAAHVTGPHVAGAQEPPPRLFPSPASNVLAALAVERVTGRPARSGAQDIFQ